jgi:LPS-assembly protein
MLKLGAWIISPLLFLPLLAQEEQVAQEPNVLLPVDTISPVPPPEIPLGAPLGDFVMPKEVRIENIGGGPISGNFNQADANAGVRYEGGVKLTGDNGLEVFADTAVLNVAKKTVTLQGNVSVYQGNALQRGERVVYHYDTKFIDTSGLRISIDPFLLESGKFSVEERNGREVYVGKNAGITTHDVQNPNFWIRSKTTTIFPEDKIVFNDLRLYAAGVPVFWLPYLSQPLDAELGYHFVPGARSSWGPFLLNTYGIMLGGETDPETGENKDAWLLSRWHLDLRGKRGIGSGVDFVDKRMDNADEISGLSLYYLNDLAPQTRRSGVPRGFVNEDRYRIQLKHRVTLPFEDDADWRIDANLNLLSDPHYLEDFVTRDYRINPSPDNTLGIFRRDDSSLLSLYLRFRINDFYRADTRLPEISFDQARAPLFGLPILHEGNTSIAYIGERADDLTKGAILNPLLKLTASNPGAQSLLNQLSGYDRQLAEQLIALPLNDPRRAALRAQLLDSSYLRLHTYQELSMPLTFADFLTIAPQTGIGFTSYNAIDGPVESMDRTTLHFGTEASLKFSKDYNGKPDPRWGLDGFKHIIQPYAYWSVVSTNDIHPGDPRVDRLTPTTRPRPLDPTRFTAVDELQSWNAVRLGTRNRLLTRRDRQSFEWLYMDTYVDAFLEDPEGARDFSNLYNDLRWNPLPWLSAELNTQFPIASNGSGFTEYDTRLRFMPSDNVEFSFGYRVLNGHPVLTDSNRIDLQTYTRLNDYWGIGTKHVMELDDNTLELEQYSVHRDLGNWVAGLGFSHRDNRTEQEYGVFLSLTLKDFPSASLPFELNAE